MHHRFAAGRGGDPPQPRREEPLAAPLVDRPGGRRHRTPEDGERPPRHETHRRLRARPLRLHLHRLLALARLHHGQHSHGRRHGAHPRAVRIPRARGTLEAPEHDPQGQDVAQPRARHRRLPADDVHAQPTQQPGRHRGAPALRRIDLRHNNPAQYPFGRSPLARKARHAVRRGRHGIGELPDPGAGVSEAQPQKQAQQ